MDPLDFASAGNLADQPVRVDTERRLQIAYAAIWDQVKERTWSGSAWNLMRALSQTTDITDIGIEYPSATRLALKLLHTRYRYGRLTTSWWASPITDRYNEMLLRQGIRQHFGKSGYQVALTIDALAVLPEPCFTYSDCSWDLTIASAPSLERYSREQNLSPATMQQRREMQVAIYEKVTGIFVESRWQARSLIEQSGISPDKIYLAPPGAVAGRREGASHKPLRQRDRPRRKLLFVGRMWEPRHFYRKGGDLVVRALEVLRREYDPQITLTMAGMDYWPLPGDIPPGVNFAGVLTSNEVAALYESHDLFVMPSRLEAFGLTFVEAMSRGMPCVARNACAMPEIVTPGISGALIEEDDEHELAAAIVSVLENDEIYQRCIDRAPSMAEYFSWERTASDMTRVLSQVT